MLARMFRLQIYWEIYNFDCPYYKNEFNSEVSTCHIDDQVPEKRKFCDNIFLIQMWKIFKRFWLHNTWTDN